MKKLQVVLVSLILFGCAKESDLIMTNQNDVNDVQLSVTESFKVGEIDANGNLIITYSMAELQDVAACAVFETNTSGLNLEQIGPDYFLAGTGNSTGSTTTFKVTMEAVGSDLMWNDGAHIAMCQTSGATPCNLTVLGEENFLCDNGIPAACNEDEAGGSSGIPYANCTNWPWAVKNKDKD